MSTLEIEKHYKCRYLLDYSETVSIIPMEYIGPHECEDGHDVPQYGIRGKAGECSN
jgi:hypothetical protein